MLSSRVLVAIVILATMLTFIMLVSADAEIESPDYAGSNTCKICHADVWEEWYSSGHAHMLMTPEEAQEVNPNLQPPPGYTWDDILYVVGGWFWKARFLNKSGYFITFHYEDGELVPGGNQWNMWTERWVDYHAGEAKMYTCGTCHTTGYDPNAPSHMGLPGIRGDWVERNIACEACHGPAKNHTSNPTNVKPKIPTDEETCGRCHIRGDPTIIDAKGGMIKHHEQYEEWLQSPHAKAGVTCTTCHDPHKSTVYEVEGALKVTCEKCHIAQAQLFRLSGHYTIGVTCIDCHMPPIGKSAEGSPLYRWGDVKSHLFSINVATDASTVPEGAKYANPYVDLGWACARPGCHGGTPLPFGASSYFASFASTREIATGISALHEDVEEKVRVLKSLYDDVKSIYEARKADLTDETRALVLDTLEKAGELITLIENDGTHGVHAPNYVPDALREAIRSLLTAKAMITLDPKWTTITVTESITITQQPATETVEKTVTKTVTETVEKTTTKTLERTLIETLEKTLTETSTQIVEKTVTETETVERGDLTGYYMAAILAIVSVILAGMLVRRR